MKHLESFKFSEQMITKKNYCDFHQFFKDNHEVLEKEVQKSGILTKKKIKKLITEFCHKTNSHITDRQLEIFIHILDINSKRYKTIILSLK